MLTESASIAQSLLREYMVEMVLRQDMTALCGVRRFLELERTFPYLCGHDGELVDFQEPCSNLQVKKPTAASYITLVENVNLIHRVQPDGYGKEALRGRKKVYLADAA